jgi:hypothetical protein
MAKNIIYLASLLLSLTLTAQNVDFENSILVTATVDGDALLLEWPNTAGVSSYFIKKREKGQANYKPLVSLPGTATSFRDTNVVKGKIYEYHITRQNSTSNVAAPIAAGIEVSPVHFRGGVLLVIESSLEAALSTELDQYESDMWNEGWTVSRIWVHSQATVDSVKQAIKAEAMLNNDIRTVVLIGRVPVPYSGYLAPDGHTPDHLGAWPADVFYGDLDGTWTDNSVNVTGASGTRNDNIPGDGKYDNSSLPGKVELEVGRIDLSDLPAFGKTEVELLQQYFAKNHAFRSGAQPYLKRGLIQNNFGSYAEAFGQSGLNNFVRFFGRDSVKYLPYKTTLQQDQYLCSYGCGAGNYQGASGIGSTSELVNENHQTIFTMLFGSYFGDWHNTNNYLRAALASGQTLTNCWAGRPVWHIHHMAVGETIGYGTKISQNNSSEFPAGNGATGVHVALMGDPTLTLLPFSGMENIKAEVVRDSVKLQWATSEKNIEGFFLYRKTKTAPKFELIATLTANDTAFTDACVLTGAYSYLIRPFRTEITGSGSYVNVGSGHHIAAEVSYNNLPEIKLDYSLEYDVLHFNAEAINGKLTKISSRELNFEGDSLPNSIYYEKDGDHKLCFTFQNQCITKDSCITFTTTSSLPDLQVDVDVAQCPDNKGRIQIRVITEKLPFKVKWSNGDSSLVLENLEAGEYSFEVTTSSGRKGSFGPYSIEIPTPFDIEYEIKPCDVALDNGQIIISDIKGGTPPYVLAINGKEITLPDTLGDLAPGDYFVVIYDQNNCAFDTFISVSRLSLTQEFNTVSPIMYIDENGQWQLKAGNEGTIIRVIDISGKLLFNGDFETASQYMQGASVPSCLYLISAINKAQKQNLLFYKWH